MPNKPHQHFGNTTQTTKPVHNHADVTVDGKQCSVDIETKNGETRVAIATGDGTTVSFSASNDIDGKKRYTMNTYEGLDRVGSQDIGREAMNRAIGKVNAAFKDGVITKQEMRTLAEYAENESAPRISGSYSRISDRDIGR